MLYLKGGPWRLYRGDAGGVAKTGWKTGLAERWDALSAVVKIAMVGKYTGLSDAYLSVLKALQHACLAANRKLDVQWVEASHLEPAAKVRAGGSARSPPHPDSSSSLGSRQRWL